MTFVGGPGAADRGAYDEDSSLLEDELMTGEAVVLDLRSMSFVLSAAGAMIDFALSVTLFLLALLVLSSPLFQLAIGESAFQAVLVGVLVVVTVGVPAIVETATHGKSLGRLAVGARIVRLDGGAIGFRHAFIRSLTGLLEFFVTLGGLAALVGLLDTKSRRLGDLLAGTYSQNERVRRVKHPLYEVPPELADWARTADVARMPDRLSRRIAQFLGHATTLNTDARLRASTSLANEAAAFISPLPATHPEALLRAVAAIRRERESRGLALERERMSQLEPALSGRPHAFPDRD